VHVFVWFLGLMFSTLWLELFLGKRPLQLANLRGTYLDPNIQFMQQRGGIVGKPLKNDGVGSLLAVFQSKRILEKRKRGQTMENASLLSTARSRYIVSINKRPIELPEQQSASLMSHKRQKSQAIKEQTNSSQNHYPP
jgi:hypothetical protein